MRVTVSRNTTSRLMKTLSRCLILSFAALSVFLSFSCKNPFETEIPDEQEVYKESEVKENSELAKEKKGGIIITLDEAVSEAQASRIGLRTVQPDFDITKLTSIILTGTKAGESTSQTIGTWSSASQLSGQMIALEGGTWNLVLTASNSSFMFTSARTVSITVGQNQNVSFVLTTSETGGGIDFKISFSSNAQSLEYILYKNNAGTFSPEDSNLNATMSPEAAGKSFTYQRTASNPVEPGTYRLVIKFYADSAKTVLLNTYSEIVNVIAGFVSRSTNKTIDLNRMYTIVYHNDLAACSILDSSGNATTLPEKYSLHTGEIQLPDLQKTGYIFEGWYAKDDAGNFLASPVTSIASSDSGDKEFWAKFIIELKEGPDFLATLQALDPSNNAERIVPSTTVPAIAVTQYLDTGTNVPVWYDSAEKAIYYFADGYTNGTAKLYLRPNSSNLFMNLTSLKVLDITPFDTSRVTNMSQMFFGASSLEKVYVSSAFTTTNVTSATNIFSYCSMLRGELGTYWNSSNASDVTYARIDTLITPGYFWSAPSSPLYFITYNCGTNPNGVNSASNPVSYTTNQLPITLANPTRSKTLANGQTGNYIFAGWYESADFSTPVLTSIPAGKNGNITLYAKWQVPYLVDHQYQNAGDDDYSHYGYEVAHGYAGAGTAATPYSGLALPEGFELKSGDPVAVSINDDGTTVVPVRYDRKLITLTFNLNGGNVGGSTATTLTREGKYGASITALATIEKEGCTFAGWRDASEVSVPFPSTYPSTNQTYTARWSIDSYTITYETNGGTIASSPELTGTYSITSAAIPLPGQTGAPSITKTGCTFAGWHALPDFSDSEQISIPAGSTGNKTFYAEWTVNSYNITYAAGASDASISIPSSSTHNYGTTVTPAWTATRAGYTFAGWLYDGVTYSNESGGTSSFSMPAANITLTAQWTANTTTPYKVKHYQQNIDDDEYTLFETDPSLTGTTDTSVTPTANSYTGFTVRTPITPILVTGNGLAEGVVYYNRNTHSVSYAQGFAGSTITVPTGDTSVKYGTSVTPVFTGMGTGTSGRTGYTFAGWKYDTTTWTSGGGQAPLSMPDTDVTFTAQWTINSYTLTYLPGATGEVTVPTASTHEYNSTFDIDFAASRDYYDFAGWKRGATTYTSSGITTFTMPAGDVELTAQWTPISYTITYELNGGTNSASNPATYNIESDFELAAPTRTDGDYRFVGWYTDLDDPTTQVEGFSPGNHGAITIKAKWLPLYATVDGVKQYTKTETIAAINAKDGTYTITLTGEVTAADLGPSGTADTILNAIRQKNESEGSGTANASITLIVQSGAGIELTTGKEMFKKCFGLVSADLRGLDTSSVTDMESMFDYCCSLTSVNLSSWDTSSVTNMQYMFNSCEQITELDLSSFDTSHVTSMNNMFHQNNRLSNLNLVSFDTSSVTNMSYMFNYFNNNGSSPATIYASDSFVVNPGTTTTYMFKNSYIEGGAGTEHLYSDYSSDASYARIDGGPSAPGYFTELPYIAKVGNTYCTTLAAALTAIENSSGELNIVLGSLATQADIGNYSTSGTIIYAIKNNCGASTVNLSVASGVTITFSGHMANLFYGCTKLKSADLRGFNTSAINGMGSMFNGCTKLESVNLSSFDTHSVTSMSSMFQGCSKLTELDLSSFNLQSVSTMSNMFKSCIQLKHIAFSQNPNTAELENLAGAFSYCSALTELDLSGFDTSNLISLNEMCRSCTALKYINLSGFECPNVGSFEAMFAYCSSLEILDLRYLGPIVNVTNVGLMFVGCDNLRKIFVNTDFVTYVGDATNSVSMFNGCNSLVGGAGTTYDASNPNDKTYAIIDGGASNPGYFSGVTDYARVGDAYYSTTETTVAAILNSTGDIDVVLVRGFLISDIGTPTTSGTIAYAISNSSDASIRLIVDRNLGLVVRDYDIISFSECQNLVYADLRGLDFSNRSSLSNLFYGCPDLKSVNLAGSVPNLNDTQMMFTNCTALEEVDISGWNFNISAPTNLNCNYMFFGCSKLKVIYASCDFPSTVSDATNLFNQCTDLKGGAGTEFDASVTNYLSRARIDGGPDNPGYFTYRAP